MTVYPSLSTYTEHSLNIGGAHHRDEGGQGSMAEVATYCPSILPFLPSPGTFGWSHRQTE